MLYFKIRRVKQNIGMQIGSAYIYIQMGQGNTFIILDERLSYELRLTLPIGVGLHVIRISSPENDPQYIPSFKLCHIYHMHLT